MSVNLQWHVKNFTIKFKWLRFTHVCPMNVTDECEFIYV